MAVNLTNADAALKSYYIDAITEQLNKKANPFLAQIEKTTNDVWGKDVRKLVQVGVNGGFGAGEEDGNLPSAEANRYVEFVTPLKNLYGTIEISDKAIRASENNAGAFVSLLNAEMEGLIKSSAYNFGRMLFGDGTGTVATIQAGNYDMCVLDTLQNISIGQVLEIADSNGNILTKYGKQRVISMCEADTTVTLEGVKLSMEEIDGQNYRFVIQGSSGKEISGLAMIFDKMRPIYGNEREFKEYLCPVSESSSSTFTLDQLQSVIDSIERRSGYAPNFILCSLEVRRILQKLLSANNRNIETMELNGGYKTMSYNGIPIVADRFCPKKNLYLLNTNDFALHQLCDWQWLSDDDGRILKQVPGKPVYTATLVKYAELMCYNPSAQGLISNITK